MATLKKKLLNSGPNAKLLKLESKKTALKTFVIGTPRVWKMP